MSKKKLDFDDDNFFNENEEIATEEHEPLAPAETGKKQASRSRLLLLVLLLVVVCAGGYFFFLAPVEEPPPPPPAPVKRAIPVPVKPPTPIPVAAENKGTVPAAAPQQPSASTAAENKGGAPAPQATSPAAAPAVKEAPAASAAPAAVAPPAKAAQAVALSVSPPAVNIDSPPADANQYSIEVGSYLLKSNRLAAEKAVRKLGYEPRITSVQRPVEMTRLRLGGPYSPMDAEIKLQEVAAVAPNAFAAPQGGRLFVYAGSFHSLDQARVYADKLYSEGIEVEEENARVVMSLEVVSFDGLANQDEAATVMTKLKATGFEPALASRK